MVSLSFKLLCVHHHIRCKSIANLSSKKKNKKASFFLKDKYFVELLYLKVWDDICRTKWVGSLGIRRMQYMNFAHIANMGWSVKVDQLWVKFLSRKYLKGRFFLAGA